jgi:hypothetical protein
VGKGGSEGDASRGDAEASFWLRDEKSGLAVRRGAHGFRVLLVQALRRLQQHRALGFGVALDARRVVEVVRVDGNVFPRVAKGLRREDSGV